MDDLANNDSEIRSKAYTYLAQREHTHDELMNKLLRRGYNQAQIKSVLKVMMQEGAISHGRFVEDYISSRHRKGYGPHRIRMELIQRGVAKDEADDGLRKTEIDWLQSAKHCYQKKYQKGEVKDIQDYAKRQRYLFQRGYSEEVVRQIVREHNSWVSGEDK